MTAQPVKANVLAKSDTANKRIEDPITNQ